MYGHYYGTSQPTIITVESPYKKSLKSKEISLFKDIFVKLMFVIMRPVFVRKRFCKALRNKYLRFKLLLYNI